MYKYDCNNEYSVCSRRNILLHLIGTFDTHLDMTVKRVCAPIAEYTDHCDCSIFLRKIESRWLNIFADHMIPANMYQQYQVPSLLSSEITYDVMMSVYDTFKQFDDFKMCIVGPFVTQVANLASIVLMSNARPTIRFFVPATDLVAAEQYLALLWANGGLRMEVLQLTDLPECVASACCHAIHVRDILAQVKPDLLQSLNSSSVTVFVEQNLGFGLHSGVVDHALDMGMGWHLAGSWYRGDTKVQVTRNSADIEIVSPILVVLDSIDPVLPVEFRVRFGTFPLAVHGQRPHGGLGKAFPIIDVDESSKVAGVQAKAPATVVFITFNEPHFIETGS